MAESFLYRSRMEAPAEAVYGWYAQPDALERLTPPWEHAEVIERTGGIEQIGSRVVLRVRIGALSRLWVSEHTQCEPGRMFRDVQLSGPFARWEHRHRFIADGPAACWLEDRIEYELPFGFLGRLVAGRFVRRKLERLFAYRHRITAEALKSEQHLGPLAG